MSIDSAACELVRVQDDGMCYGPADTDGGTYSCEIYNAATGGVPIATHTTFDWETTGSWPGYAGSHWGSATGDMLTMAEVAMQLEWTAGLSSSGKPVILRKWYHAVPQVDVLPTAPEIASGVQTSLLAGAEALKDALTSYGLVLGSSTGRFAGTASVKGFYGNHQMPRGRRRRALVSSSGIYRGPVVKVPPDFNVEGE